MTIFELVENLQSNTTTVSNKTVDILTVSSRLLNLNIDVVLQ